MIGAKKKAIMEADDRLKNHEGNIYDAMSAVREGKKEFGFYENNGD